MRFTFNSIREVTQCEAGRVKRGGDNYLTGIFAVPLTTITWGHEGRKLVICVCLQAGVEGERRGGAVAAAAPGKRNVNLN